MSELVTLPNKPIVSISKLVFSGGSNFSLGPNEKIILVGPNNSGKSQSLRDILAICDSGKNEQAIVISEIEISKSCSTEEFRKFLVEEADYVNGTYRHKDWQVPESHIQFWEYPYLIHGLSPGFIKKIAADDRLMVCEQQQSISPGDQKSKPQHVLYDDEALMKKISGLFKRAFGKELMFDFRGGSRLPIHVGEPPKLEGTVDRVGDSYVNAIRQNPLLDKQGDGMKSYAGILFEAVVADRNVTLIDEPEAFLHPPQMRRLGETLSSEVSGQLIVSTHSSDILRGFLEGTQGDVRILRIRREGIVNIVSEASPEVIKELWEKPELRYSNALEGIFHEQTIICEDDSDCRLINSIADHLSAGSIEQWKDTAYVPTGGKHGIPKVAGVLRKIGVPVKAVFDIDFLSERDLVRSTVTAFGGLWDEIEPLWARVDTAVRNGIKAKTVEQIKQEVIMILNSSGDGDLPKGDIAEAMKQGKPWAEIKKYGTRAIPNGDAQRDYNNLRDKLEEVGIFLVPVGEIENFCPEIGSHGPKFVNKLLSNISLSDNRLDELRIFVERVHKGLHSKLDN
ncbi:MULTISPECIES: ATP-dependent nuclease [unclassified Pseudomonas]|uniref:ATP-dependent nuclease n=1 Tax=unclassified Pseudomonas TaxID=196821 RepID=UPI001356B8AE|nr:MULTISPECIES: AAA family ATPase [unclassified Pseudomonas]